MKFTIKQFIRQASLFAVIAAVGFGGWYGFNLYKAMARITGNSSPVQLVSAFTGTKLQETAGRTNILVAGYSNDDSGHAGAELTDSIMIISIDQAANTASIISVPRDLYVNIPGSGYSKINAAYEYGQSQGFAEVGYAAGGMGLLEKTIQDSLGIHSDYQALINYTAFKDLVNAVGGVTVTINSSSVNGLYDPNTNLDLPNGTVSLDGQTALNLARARGEGTGSYGFPDGDFTRTEHQQQLLLALKQKAAGSLSLSSIAGIAQALGDNVKTDLSLGELKTLYSILKDMDEASVRTMTLNDLSGTNLLSYYTTSGGQSTLVPAAGINDFSAIQSALLEALGGGSNG